MNNDFIDWLIEQRIDWLVRSKNLFTDEWLINELQSLIVCEQDVISEVKTRLVLIVDRLGEERKELYKSGLTDGISVMRRINMI